MLPRKPSHEDGAQISFKTEAVAPGAVAEILVGLQGRLFRGQKLVVHHNSMEAFELTSIEVDGVESMPVPRLNWAERLVLWWHKTKAVPHPIPGLCFAAEALGNGMMMPTASKTLQLRVRNVASKPSDFVGYLYGQGLR